MPSNHGLNRLEKRSISGRVRTSVFRSCSPFTHIQGESYAVRERERRGRYALIKRFSNPPWWTGILNIMLCECGTTGSCEQRKITVHNETVLCSALGTPNGARSHSCTHKSTNHFHALLRSSHSGSSAKRWKAMSRKVQIVQLTEAA